MALSSKEARYTAKDIDLLTKPSTTIWLLRVVVTVDGHYHSSRQNVARYYINLILNGSPVPCRAKKRGLTRGHGMAVRPCNLRDAVGSKKRRKRRCSQTDRVR